MLPARRILPVATLLLLLPVVARAQAIVGRADSVYTWRGTLPSGATLTVRNFNGPIEVRPASGTTAELTARKRTRRGARIDDVGFDLVTSRDGDVEICSVYRGSNPCDGERRWSGSDDGDRGEISVAMTLLVPRGVQVKVTTGNGDLSIEGVGGVVQATTGNGRVDLAGTEGAVRVTTGNGDVDVRDAKASVRATTGNGRVTVLTSEGPVNASTGNGDIDVRMTALRGSEGMQFHTGSGAVRVTLPASFSGELDATTGNGDLRSDFDLKVRGRVSPQHVRATIGDGGPLLRLTTGNGRLELLKAP